MNLPKIPETPKIVAAILGLVIAVTAIYSFTRKEPESPPNDRVSEVAFDRLRSGMTSEQVDSLLGPPHSIAGGEVVRVERLDSADAHCTIDDQPRSEGGNRLQIYRGRNEESIAVLFAARTGTVAAIEYRVSDCPVIYRGPMTAAKTKPMAAVATGRIVGSDEVQKQRDNVAKFERRTALEKSAAGSSFALSPTQPPVESSPPSPVQPTVSVASVSPPAPGPLAPQPPAEEPPAATPPSSATAPSAPAGPPISPARPLTPAPAIASNAAASPRGPWRLTLPSGRVLTESNPSFDPFVPRPAGLPSMGGVPMGSAQHVEKYPSGAQRGLFATDKGKLDGQATTFYESGHLETAALYIEGKLDTALKAWSENKERLLYAEYKKGNKDGLVCLWRNQLPWLVQQWKGNSLKAEYLVKNVESDLVPLAEPSLSEAEVAELAQARQQLNELQSNLRHYADEVKQRAKEEYDKLKPKSAPKASPSSAARRVHP